MPPCQPRTPAHAVGTARQRPRAGVSFSSGARLADIHPFRLFPSPQALYRSKEPGTMGGALA